MDRRVICFMVTSSPLEGYPSYKESRPELSASILQAFLRAPLVRALCPASAAQVIVRWGSGLGAPTREGTPKHATGTCACPNLLRAPECRFRGALACKAPCAPTPSATYRVVQRFPNAGARRAGPESPPSRGRSPPEPSPAS